MKQSLKTKLSLAIAASVLLAVTLISLLANYFIDDRFNKYISLQRSHETQIIVSSLSRQYDIRTGKWNTEFIHTIGMSALYEGYIIKVYDKYDNTVWDAESHDTKLCHHIMEEISGRMRSRLKDGKITTENFILTSDGTKIGSVDIRFFGPYFLNENDFRFLDSLNIILVSAGSFSLLISVLIGILMAKRLSRPVLKTADAAEQISAGNYEIRVNEKAGTNEIHRLVISINKLAATLQQQEKLRRQLTEDVSHELRTPVAILQSHIEAMAEGIWEPDAQRLRSCGDEVARIGSLIGEIEKLAQFDSGVFKLNKTQTDLFEIADKAVKSFEAIIKAKGLHVSVNGKTLVVSADADKICQVMMNLLSNAVKYSNDGGNIEINLSETEKNAVIAVRDDGIGIPENELPYIFERFYRADKSRNRKTGGSGLGLAIVKSIVEAHGGTVSAESSPNEGSLFKIMLPR